MLADYLPLMPSGARRAGAAKVMAARIGRDPSFLVTDPIKTQLAAMGIGAIGGAYTEGAGTPVRAAAAVLPLLLTQALRRREIKSIQGDYDSKKRKRLRELDEEDLLGGMGGSARLGAVGAYEAMRQRKYQDIGHLSEAGDALAMTIGGLHLPVTNWIDHRSADRLRKEADFTDQKNSPTIPLMLAAGLLSGAGLGAARAWNHREMQGAEAMPTDQWSPLVQEISGGKPLVYSAEGLGNAGYGKPRNERQARQFLRYLSGFQDTEPAPRSTFFDRRPVLDEKSRLRRLMEHGAVFADSKMSKPVIAHEAGHAKIENTPGVLRALQRHVYPYGSALAPLAGVGSMAAGLASGGAIRGALLGTGIGALTNIGVVAPEIGASYHASKALNDKGQLEGGHVRGLAAALSTYLAAGVLPSTIAGAAGGWISGRRKKKREREEEAEKSAGLGDGIFREPENSDVVLEHGNIKIHAGQNDWECAHSYVWAVLGDYTVWCAPHYDGGCDSDRPESEQADLWEKGSKFPRRWLDCAIGKCDPNEDPGDRKIMAELARAVSEDGLMADLVADSGEEGAVKKAAIPQEEILAAGQRKEILTQLIEAKKHSDARRYAMKHAILRRLVTNHPEQFAEDSRSKGIVGVTHEPTNFKIHMPAHTIPQPLQKAARPALKQIQGLMPSSWTKGKQSIRDLLTTGWSKQKGEGSLKDVLSRKADSAAQHVADSTGTDNLAWLPYLGLGSGKAFGKAFKGKHGQRSLREGLMTGAATGAAALGADKVADGEVDSPIANTLAALLGGVAPGAARGARLVGRNVARNTALATRLQRGGFTASEKADGLEGQLKALTSGGLSGKKESIKKLLGDIKGTQRELKVGFLTNEMQDTKKTSKGVDQAVKRWGVTDMDAGHIINPSVANMVESGRWATDLGDRGFKRFRGTMAHSATKKVDSATAKHVWDMVGRRFGDEDWGNAEGFVPAWSSIKKLKDKTLLQRLEAAGVANAADWRSLTGNAFWQADNYYGAVAPKNIKIDFGTPLRRRGAPTLEGADAARKPPNVRRFFDTRSDPGSFDIDLTQPQTVVQ